MAFALEILPAVDKLALMSHILGEDTEIILDAKALLEDPGIVTPAQVHARCAELAVSRLLQAVGAASVAPS